MFQRPDISIIVPVYNTEKYLHKCIDSILTQTFTDFELLLINDGSTDNSGNICDEYAQKDSRIQVFHKENGGVSTARNLGLDNATGNWIMFVDSDDWCDTKICKVLYDNAIKYNADISLCDLIRYGKNENKLIFATKTKSSKTRLLSRIFLKKEMLNSKISSAAGPCAKLIKSKIIFDNNIRFDAEIQYGEDILFVYEILNKINNAIYIQLALYHYQYNLSSITKQKGLTEKRKTLFIAFDKMIAIESNHKLKKSILARKAVSAVTNTSYCIIFEGYVNNNSYIFFNNILKQNRQYLLMSKGFSLKHKLMAVLLICPGLYKYLVRYIYQKLFHGKL